MSTIFQSRRILGAAPGVLVVVVLFVLAGRAARAAQVHERYFAHPAVHDRHGVIAPWYQGQNGQLDFRIRVGAETLKRYPWADKNLAVMPGPHCIFNGQWTIEPSGVIHVNPGLPDWDNGDIGQRSYSLLAGMIEYYRYSGDPAAIGLISMTADYVLDYCQTPADHPWPHFMVSCPTKGKAYGRANPNGFIQLDITALIGSQLLKAYQLTGNARYCEAAKHWADLLAQHCDHTPGHAPWGRYANPSDSQFENRMTGSIVFVLQLLDDLIRMGYTGDGALIKARDTGEKHLRDALLPEWTRDPTFGHYFWDWNNQTATCSIPCYAAHYLMSRREVFPEWETDVRNMLTLLFCRTSVDPASAADVYSGAWAFPESSTCCGKSLQYPTMMMAFTMARYGLVAGSDWAREVARRQSLLMTYDATETGVVIDGIDGSVPVAGAWFNLAHPLPLVCALEALSWQPEWFGASRENHLVRTTSVVQNVQYGKGRIAYRTLDAPTGAKEVLRLAFEPTSILADGKPLQPKEALTECGYALQSLRDGDWLVTIRHDRSREIVVQGDDPQEFLEDGRLQYEGSWSTVDLAGASGGQFHETSQQGASVSFSFEGNQARILGQASPNGGKADVYIDGVKQLCGIDGWCPDTRDQQVVYYRSGLPQGKHTIRIVALGEKNPVSGGTKVSVDAVQWSAAQPKVKPDYGEGGGPSGAQRMVFGYTGRRDLKDSAGQLWRPGTEHIVRLRAGADSVVQTWWTTPAAGPIRGTNDAELYRYGIHAKEFVVNLTVGPGKYRARLKFAAARKLDSDRNCITLAINGRQVIKKMDVGATAGGPNRAMDLVFDDIEPRNGAIDFHFLGGDPSVGVDGEAFVQAIELTPASADAGSKPTAPVTVAYRNLLRNPGFEEWSQAPTKPSAARWESDGASPPCREAGAGAAEEVAEGSDAIRMAGQGHSRLYQEIAVRPRSDYRGSVFVRACDTQNRGFGRSPGDSAGLILEELDAAGRTLVAHPKAAVTQAGPFQYVSIPITTTDNTAKIRFVLDTQQGAESQQGWITYDQAVLDGPPGPAMLIGIVTDDRNKAPIAGALVAAGDQSVRTGADGRFTLTGLADFTTIAVEALKQGHLPQARVVQLSAGENRCDFTLAFLPTANLLVNGDFEQGFAAARSVEHGTSGARGPWSFRFSPAVASYLYAESGYDWRKPCVFRGKESIGYVTDGGGEMQLSQDVAVDPHTKLVASAWVRGLDVAGTGEGFGAGDKDFAGIWIQQLDARGNVLANHEKVGIRKATPGFEQVRCEITTGPTTAKVRFTLSSTIGCVWRKGAAIFDDCSLEKP